MKFFKKLVSATLAVSMVFASFAVNSAFVSAAPTISAGWNETLYAEWADSNPDSPDVKVGYKLSSATDYTYLTGNDLTYLVRPASQSGYGRVDIPGLKEGRYDLYIKASDGTEHTRTGIKVYSYDRSGYAHWNYSEGVGGYNNDGTPKDNAIIVYVTDENKDTVEVPGYEGHPVISYSTSSGNWTRTTEGIGNILNNNYKYIQEITITDNHPLIIRLIGKVNVPKNLTPKGVKDIALGGGDKDNGNLAITKYSRNITIEGIGDDATVDGWGFTFSQTGTCPPEAGKSFEVRNLTFKNYTEDGLGFQGDDAVSYPIQRVWVHNNVFYPGHCDNPMESDKAEGDGSCDFKRGQYYTMSYNHYIECHKTNLIGASEKNDQFYMTLHHNWYQNVASRQPLAAGGNLHIYNTYFQDEMISKDKHYNSQVIDLRGKAACFSEANYFDNCKNAYASRHSTSNIKTFNDYLGTSTIDDIAGTKTVAETRDQSGIPDNGLKFPDGGSMKDYDTNTKYFYYDPVNNRSDVSVLNDVMDVPEYVKTYAGTLKAFPETESGEIAVTVTTGGVAVNDASVTANGLTFKNQGNGLYTATASLGAEYVITVSKEGYSNVVIKSDVLNKDGDTFNASADLKVDYDGYAVVKLTGGSDNAPVKGASVVLNDGTVLVDQNDGTYKSANQLATGSYTATITNTGDYIAPSAPQAVTVRTTDVATEIHLDKLKGAVSVTLKAAEGETQALDLTRADVYVGTTALTNDGNGVFTGNVEVSTPYDVYVNVPGWNTVSVTPAQLTAAKEGTASAVAELKYKGSLFTWNYTNGTNTEDFFTVSSASSWSSAKNNPQTYDGETLTAAIKMQSATTITFNAPADGEIALVMEAKSGSSVYVNDVSYDVTTGTNIIPVKAGLNTIKKNKTESHLYLVQYCAGEIGPNPPTPTPNTTTSTTETTTETTTELATEAPYDTTPVELGEAVTNSGDGISVTYDSTNDVWNLTDTSASLAAELTIPFKTPITKGKVVISGTAIPSSASGSWAFVKVLGTNGVDGMAMDVADLATDKNKNITLRTDGTVYAASTTAIAANANYGYRFVIDLDNKTVELTVNGQKYTGTTTASELTGFGSITSAKSSRNVTVSTPSVGIVKEAPAGLSDEIMWSVKDDFTPEGSNGLTAGITFYALTEENGAVSFVDGDNTYQLENYLRPNVDAHGATGLNPMNEPENKGIPVKDGFMKFVPEKDGVFTMAVKTNGNKQTYVTDETGAVVKSVENTEGSSRYDIVRFNVKAGKSYHIFGAGSKTCLFYLGYTSDTSIPIEPLYGDADADGNVNIFDVSIIMNYVLRAVPYSNETEYVDVNGDGKVDSVDVAMVLQHVLDKSYTLPRK